MSPRGRLALTFADFGIPFPLFEAPVEEAAGYAGLGQCSLCGATERHCFELGIGDEVVVKCKDCGTERALPADEAIDAVCRTCGATVAFPKQVTGDLKICYECLRAGRAAIGKGTVPGTLGWEEAKAGRINVTAVGTELLFDLLRTPNYLTFQEDSWEFCCGKPMVYLGPWLEGDFEQHAPDGDGRALFLRIVDHAQGDLWQGGRLARSIGTYMFRCSVCGRYKGHWDMD